MLGQSRLRRLESVLDGEFWVEQVSAKHVGEATNHEYIERGSNSGKLSGWPGADGASVLSALLGSAPRHREPGVPTVLSPWTSIERGTRNPADRFPGIPARDCDVSLDHSPCRPIRSHRRWQPQVAYDIGCGRRSACWVAGCFGLGNRDQLRSLQS